MFGNGYLVHIIPTLHCNLRCPYCYTNAVGYSSLEINNEEYIQETCRLINSLEISAIHIEGGEPFVYSRLHELLSQINDKSKISIVTNGYLVTEENLKQIIELGVTNFIVSIDYIKSSVRTDMKSCVKSLNIFNSCGIKPEVSVTLSKNNLKDIDELLGLLNEYQLSGIRFGDIVSVGYAEQMKQDILDSRDYQTLIPHILNKNTPCVRLSLHGSTWEKCDSAFIEQYESKSSIRHCDMNGTKLTIMPNGDVFTCFNLINDARYKVGNLFDCKKDSQVGNILKHLKCIDGCARCPVGIGYHIGF